ncbi:MAG: NUDIX domain-containing protein [Alicyclobacillus herbarius]|uniref:NUDIX hydrolase n=1 Tax=Alicyclobacillus herbarius TaxID=122960 RepID=UPI0003FC2B8B|nr:NUDIX domain-containing protein [Alicyclobacillus herbarius]MCL6632856.1 NUDIX domain-containing protein [Alicyclobacillus herbarius]
MGRSSFWQRAVVQTYAHMPRWLTSPVVRMVKRQYPIGVAVVVFDDANRLLVLRHTYGDPPWRLPGGLMERGESVYETAAREVREEACCEVRPEWIVEAEPAVYTFDVVLLATSIAQLPFTASAEIAERRWMQVEEFYQLNDDQRPYVERAHWLRQRLGC